MDWNWISQEYTCYLPCTGHTTEKLLMIKVNNCKVAGKQQRFAGEKRSVVMMPEGFYVSLNVREWHLFFKLFQKKVPSDSKKINYWMSDVDKGGVGKHISIHPPGRVHVLTQSLFLLLQVEKKTFFFQSWLILSLSSFYIKKNVDDRSSVS